MHKLCRIDINRIEEINERIEKYKEKVVEKIKPEKIILFGSFARGDINEASDIDIIVIADWKEGFLDRIKVLLDLNEFKIPIQAIGYTQGEFEEMVKRGNQFILKVKEEGKIIYSLT
ncbi:hypothetical protein HRbin06_00571 [archaeon HR06]|nr:hypothetical protein HRbin06_00571 [archaeon HR06]